MDYDLIIDILNDCDELETNSIIYLYLRLTKRSLSDFVEISNIVIDCVNEYFIEIMLYLQDVTEIVSEKGNVSLLLLLLYENEIEITKNILKHKRLKKIKEAYIQRLRFQYAKTEFEQILTDYLRQNYPLTNSN